MSALTQNIYPKDLTMTLPSNKIDGERREFTQLEDKIFVPNGGPFYSQSLIIKDNNGNLLKPNLDYKLLHLDAEASRESGRDVVAVIWVMKQTIPYVTYDYRVIGGEYGNTVGAILEVIKQGGGDGSVDWNSQVFNKPENYPPSPHIHTPESYSDWSVVSAQLDGIRKAIIGGDYASWESHYNYIDRRSANIEQNVKTLLASYATLEYVNGLALGSSSGGGVIDLSGYYTALQIDGKLSTITGSIGEVNNRFINYSDIISSDLRYLLKNEAYTKEQSDAKYAIAGISYSVVQSDNRYAQKLDLQAYATNVSINELTVTLNNRIDTIIAGASDIDLSSYYTKNEVYSKNEIDTRNYTKTEVAERHYTKSEIDAALQSISALRDEINDLKLKSQAYKVGDIFVTTLHFTSSTQVNAHLGYGNWQRVAEGRALVGMSTRADDPTWTRTVQSNYGTYEHTLSLPEMPEHNHNLLINSWRFGMDGSRSSVARYSDGDSTTSPIRYPTDYNTVIDNAGMSRPHNNTQPSFVAGMWVRVTDTP